MAKRQAEAREALLVSDSVPETLEDQHFIEQAGRSVVAFFAKAALFLKTGHQLEERSKATEVRALARTTVPTLLAEDEVLQVEIKAVTAEQKEIEGHWDPMAAIFNQGHKFFTGGRKRGLEPLGRASQHLNGLHSRYLDAERRRAAEENERRRREEEDRQRKEQEQRAADAEAEAIRLEALAPGLSGREKAFVQMIVAGTEPVAAAKYSGFKSPKADATRLMNAEKILDAIEAERSVAQLRQQAAAIREQPIDTSKVQTVRPNISTVASGGVDRSTHSAEVLDEAAFIEAVISGRYGIPHTVLTVKQSALNECARSLREHVSRWPGIAYRKTDKLV